MQIFGIKALTSIACLWMASACATAQTSVSVEELFEADHKNGLVMQVEAAIATAQADYGVVSTAAAQEITAKADTSYAPSEDIAAEYERVRHRMVALLNVWRRSLSDEADDALHLGVTTVDIYDTVLILQLLAALDVMHEDMLAIETDLVCLAQQYRDTPMIGRTLGQHALPITFGKKVSVWAAQNRRNIDRLHEVKARLRTSGVLKGAVGTHLGLGPDAVGIEQRVSELLSLDQPEPADWRPARDVFAEYAQVLALTAKSNASIGQEIFRMQMTDIGELYERRRSTAVGSSTMPHKRNPSLSEALIHYGRTVPAMADVVLADVESVFERDNTSRANGALKNISVEAADMIATSQRLLTRLEVNPDHMRENLGRTDGMIMSQRIMLFLAEQISREDAETRVREAAALSLDTGMSFREALLADPVIGPILKDDIDTLLDPVTSLGLAGLQVTRTVDWIKQKRASHGEPDLAACARE